MKKERKAGILLHITSLPGKYGIGSLGKEAYEFVDFLAESNLKLWQILPLTPTGFGDSPYASFASNGLNYYMIDIEQLIEEKLIDKRVVDNLDFGDGKRVDYDKIYKTKTYCLREAFTKFNVNDLDFNNFVMGGFATDYALYMTLKFKFNNKPWYLWPDMYKNYSKEVEELVIKENEIEFLFWVFTQYIFTKQWNKLHCYAQSKNVEIIGDIPLYVSYDSVDVWKYSKYFDLNEAKEMNNVAGCPPDAFSEDGQLWGNPVYNWKTLKEDNYIWWKNRINNTLKYVDILRIDHFRAFDRFYAIKNGSENARHGVWVDGPKFDFFKDILDYKIIAEDLGVIDEGVRTLMKEVKYPGMKILEFAFDGNKNNEHKPSNYEENCVCYTGTHDNMPLYQYVKDIKAANILEYVSDIAKEAVLLDFDIKTNTTEDIVWSIIEMAFRSKAFMTIIPIQDFLCQDGNSRMNLPSNVSKSNWSYRIEKQDLTIELSNRIKSLVEVSNR